MLVEVESDDETNFLSERTAAGGEELAIAPAEPPFDSQPTANAVTPAPPTASAHLASKVAIPAAAAQTAAQSTDQTNASTPPDKTTDQPVATQPTMQPAIQPSSQPATEPNTQPSSQPATEPNTQPAAQPASQPTAQPAAESIAQPAAQPAIQPAISLLPSPPPSLLPSLPRTPPYPSQPAAEPAQGPLHSPPLFSLPSLPRALHSPLFSLPLSLPKALHSPQQPAAELCPRPSQQPPVQPGDSLPRPANSPLPLSSSCRVTKAPQQPPMFSLLPSLPRAPSTIPVQPAAEPAQGPLHSHPCPACCRACPGPFHSPPVQPAAQPAQGPTATPAEPAAQPAQDLSTVSSTQPTAEPAQDSSTTVPTQPLALEIRTPSATRTDLAETDFAQPPAGSPSAFHPGSRNAAQAPSGLPLSMHMQTTAQGVQAHEDRTQIEAEELLQAIGLGNNAEDEETLAVVDLEFSSDDVADLGTSPFGGPHEREDSAQPTPAGTRSMRSMDEAVQARVLDPEEEGSFLGDDPDWKSLDADDLYDDMPSPGKPGTHNMSLQAEETDDGLEFPQREDVEFGEIIFKNHHTAKYIIPPKDCSHEELLQTLMDLWELSLPKLAISVTGSDLDTQDWLPPDTPEEKLQLLYSRTKQFFNRGLARAAVNTSSWILTSGIRKGLVNLVGQGVAERGYRSTCIGMLALGTVHGYERLRDKHSLSERVRMPRLPLNNKTEVELEPNHSHFILFPAYKYNAEVVKFRFDFEQALSNYVPKVCLLANGGHYSKMYVLEYVRHGQPIIVCKGTGADADAICKHWEAKQEQQKQEMNNRKDVTKELIVEDLTNIDVNEAAGGKAPQVQSPMYDRSGSPGQVKGIVAATGLKEYSGAMKDSVMTELINDGHFHLFDMIEAKVDEIDDIIMKCISTTTEVEDTEMDVIQLAAAWKLYHLFHHNANMQRWVTYSLTNLLLLLNLSAALVVLIKTQLLIEDRITDNDKTGTAFYYIIICIPIITGMVQAMINHFSPKSKWLMLRVCSERVKAEIFKYRMHVAEYSGLRSQNKNTKTETRHVILAQQLEAISQQVYTSEVAVGALHKPDPKSVRGYMVKMKEKTFSGGVDGSPGDDGLSRMHAEDYLRFRINDEIDYYTSKIPTLEHSVNTLQVAMYFLSAAGAILGTMGHVWQLWVSITVVLTSALSTIYEGRQLHAKLEKSNRALCTLVNIKNWWKSLSLIGQASPMNIRQLVTDTEELVEEELSTFIKLAREGANKEDSEDSKEEEGNTDQQKSTSKKEDTKASEKTNSAPQGSSEPTK
ncbi:hypothetical protein CYMTET_48144 [Cymbomonas tetramitiformis]|uniref:SMODS and SLOG-associating 2TM effector domain-containing protein n=1 Tax=Cymbomonas tetramitiformis TaxID=36881 RepID=A0AAE0BU49_9CHLO|nr:hypothetical protein CYMTET_48144 [Cymbomonas tetramitiformis]